MSRKIMVLVFLSLLDFNSFCFAKSKAEKYKVLASGLYSTQESYEKKVIVLRTKKAFEDEFKKYPVSLESYPNIDFKKSAVVLLTMGERPYTGFYIKIDAIKVKENEVKVFARFVRPSENCGSFQVLTNPYVFIEVPSNKKVVIVKKSFIEQCK